jgi:hypothetical protein
VKGKLKSNLEFQCSRCSRLIDKQDTGNDKTYLALDKDAKFELVDRFCYLGELIGAGGGAVGGGVSFKDESQMCMGQV